MNKIKNSQDRQAQQHQQHNESTIDINQKQTYQYIRTTKTIKKQSYRFQQIQNANANIVNTQKQRKGLFIIILILFILAFFSADIIISQVYKNKQQSNIKTITKLNKYNQVTAILFIVNTQIQALKSIQSLISHSSFSKIIIGSHQKISNNNIKDFPKIQWEIQKRPQYDLYMLDNLISKVETDYYFLATTQWKFGNQSFIDYSIKILNQFPDVAQVIPAIQKNLGQKQIKQAGFSFLPSVHRKKDYLLCKDGFSGITSGAVNSKQVEIKISQFYLKNKIYTINLKSDYRITRISNQRQQKKTPITTSKFQQIQVRPKQQKFKQPQAFNAIQNQQAKQQLKKHTQQKIFVQLPNNGQNFFTNKFRNSQNFVSFQQYLLFNGARRVLLVGCDQNCQESYKTKKFGQMQVSKVSHISSISVGQSPQQITIFDWISSESLQSFANSMVQPNFPIYKYTRFGFSLRWSGLQYNKQGMEKMIAYFSSNGFYFDETKSLSFRAIEDKLVMIFIKGKKSELNFVQSPAPRNTLAIQTVLKIKQNLPFLREWLGYHINLGFDKFFLYDNSNSVVSKNDPKMTSSSNKFGMDYGCLGLSDQQINGQWQLIWAQFYDYIVYIKFQPKDESGAISYNQVRAQQQYLKFFKDVAKYTLFIDVDELLFSPQNKNLIQTLKFYQSNRITSLKLSQRHFVNRFCAKNQRMTDIFYYFPENTNRLWDTKIIVQTNSFLPFESIHDGRPIRGRQIILSQNQFRINHYNFEKDGLDFMRRNSISNAQKFQLDNSAHRYKNQLDKICKSECSQKFEIKCPAGVQWNNCLDISQYYPYEGSQTKNQVPSQNQNTFQQQPRSKPVQQVPQQPKQISSSNSIILTHLAQVQMNMRPANKIFEIQLLKVVNDLPMCLVILPSEKHSQEQLLYSVTAQQYSNFTTIRIPPLQSLNNEQINYYTFRYLMGHQCKENAMTMFVSVPLQKGALKQLNSLMQQHRAYIAYSKTSQFTQVLAFYPRIYELLDLNDFGKTNQPYLKNNDRQVQTLGLLQLSKLYALQINKQTIFNPKQPSYFAIQKNSTSNSGRGQYNKIIRLSEDMEINTAMYQRSLYAISSLRPITISKLDNKNMLRAVDRQQLWYLPEGHSIQQLQYEQYSRKYKINEYQDISQQVHFCVTVLSHNNIQNNRYIKVMKSIVQQKYENYHIVFIDDFSTDNNMNGTIEYMKSIGFPKEKIVYVQNLRRNYATYNIINAAFNYCGQQDVQMLVDGDDQFVGKYAFHVMNSYYQQDPQTWIAYSNYKTNFYGFGRSRQLNSEFDHASNGVRSYISVLGAIRTWKVKIVSQIPLSNHKMQTGQWLDTVYDDALSHPLAEMSTVKRMKYVPELLYQYNMRYGDNDDSTAQKIRHRSQAYRHVISLPLLSPLATLQGLTKNLDVQKQLSIDLGIRYKVIQVE